MVVVVVAVALAEGLDVNSETVIIVKVGSCQNGALFMLLLAPVNKLTDF